MVGCAVRDAADIVASQMTEAELLEQVKAVAQTLGWRLYHAFNSRRSAAGFPDLALVRPPRVIFMELKSEKGRLDTRRRFSPRTGRALPNQKDWKDAFEACPGVEYYLWRPRHWDEIMEVLR